MIATFTARGEGICRRIAIFSRRRAERSNLDDGGEMSKVTVLTMAMAVLSTSVAAQTAMKPGLWEMRTIKHVMDGRDMMAQMAAAQAQMQQMMANMPSGQKKQMEAMMGRQGASAPNVHRICVSAEMAEREQPVVVADSKCEPSNVSRSGNRMTYQIDCVAQGTTMTGKGESVFAGDTVAGKMDMTTAGRDGRHSMQMESQMKYLGADCQGLKPADQIARDLQQAKRGK